MKRPRLAIFIGVIVLQVAGLCGLEAYLSPANAQVSATVSAPKAKVSPPAPEDVLLYDIDKSGDALAYVDHNDQVIVKTDEQTVSQPLPDVKFLQWLDDGMSVLYVRDNYGQNELGVYNVQQNSVMPLYDIPGDNVTIDTVYKSTYSQTIHLLYHDGDQAYIGSYEEITGWRSTPLIGITPKSSSFDEKEDVVYITDESGTVWRFQNGDLTDEQQQESGK